MTALSDKDASARQEALDITRSFCVQAPAGSGKTELLTQRLLCLLAHSEQPEEILAFTFTRKASHEMRRRLLDNLEEAAGISDEELDAASAHRKLTLSLARKVLARNHEKDWKLLENPQRLRINTIDAFNHYLNRHMPVISGLGMQAEIDDDITACFEQAAENLLGKLELEGELAQALVIILERVDNSLPKMRKLLTTLLTKREQWLPHVYTYKGDPEKFRLLMEDALSGIISETLLQLRNALAPLQPMLTELLAYAASNLADSDHNPLSGYQQSSELPPASPAHRSSWLAIASFFLTGKDEPRKTVRADNGFPSPSSANTPARKKLFKDRKDDFGRLASQLAEDEHLLGLLCSVRSLPADTPDADEWQSIAALATVLPHLLAELNVLMQAQGKADHTQVAFSALAALGNEQVVSDLALRLDYRIRHILIDEFQDTSSIQSELLHKLTAGWEAGDGRTLFIVGDGMQSCYSFRNANVGLFLEARDHGIGAVRLHALKLQKNFRSTPEVVDWVNQVFSRAFPASDDISRGAVTYSHSISAAESLPDSGVQTRLLVHKAEDDISKELLREREAELLLEQIIKLRAADPDASIAILVRGRRHLLALVPKLRAHELRWDASDIDPLSSQLAVTDILSLLKALLNLADFSALLALLRSPFIGLGLNDMLLLHKYAKHRGSSLWQSLRDFGSCDMLSAEGRMRLQRCVPILHRARQGRMQRPLRQWLEETWFELGGPATLSEAAEFEHITRFLDLVETESEAGDIRDIHAFEDKCSTIFAASRKRDGKALQIMTIHKAKGLEFDYVLIPGLERESASDDKPLFIWKEHLDHTGHKHLLLAAMNARGTEESPTYRYLRLEDRLRTTLENTRLLYIAVTRAARKAFLYASLKLDDKGEPGKPAASSLLAGIWPVLLDDMVPAVERTNYTAPKAAIHDQQQLAVRSRSLPADWQHPLRNFPVSAEESVADNPPPAYQPLHANRLLAIRSGDFIHEALKLRTENPELYARAMQNRAFDPHWRQGLQLICRHEDEIRQCLERIHTQLQTALRHPQAEWLFDHKHRESACELSISDYSRGWRKEYILDRTFIDAGERWIIDYKSAEPAPGQALHLFLEEQTALYREQLSNYARIFQQMKPGEIRLALFFTALPELLEIEPAML